MLAEGGSGGGSGRVNGETGMDGIGVGLIGTGFMGKCHALAWNAVAATFGLAARPRLEMLADLDPRQAASAAAAFGFARGIADWRALVTDPAGAVVPTTAPNALPREMGEAALAAGKHVWCEKPMALTVADAEAMAEAARAAGRVTLLGYNYLRNPAIAHARRLIGSGAIGEVFQFRGVCDEDYMADPAGPWSWRCHAAEAGTGTLGDLACHLVSVAVHLLGPIEAVASEVRTVHAVRPGADGAAGSARPVDTDDVATALVRFAGGAGGMLSSSRITWGRKNHLAFEVHGSRGSILFDQERMNELSLFEAAGDPAARGFRTILTGPAHPPYGRFVPVPGHGLGFNDLKVIEAAALLDAIAGGAAAWPDFEAGLGIERVIHAMAAGGGWRPVAP